MASRPSRRSILALFLAIPFSACYRWDPAPMSPRLVVEDRPQAVRITEVGSDERYRVDLPYLESDPIAGRGLYRRVALEDVSRLEVRSFDTAATVGWLNGAAIAGFLFGELVKEIDLDSGWNWSTGSTGSCWIMC